jgi:hypothetical protein
MALAQAEVMTRVLKAQFLRREVGFFVETTEERMGKMKCLTKLAIVLIASTSVIFSTSASAQNQSCDPMISAQNCDAMLVRSFIFDRVFLKNGDIISGQILKETFKLRTSYATFKFELPQIAYIDFEGGGKNMDIIVLKVGDKLSGIVEAPVITLQIQPGTEIDLDKQKIKRITFKRITLTK